MANKLEETNRELDQSKSESKEIQREIQRLESMEKQSHPIEVYFSSFYIAVLVNRYEAELKKARENLKVVEAVMKEEKTKRSTVEEDLQAKEQLCNKFEDKIETLKAALEEMNSRLERECASHKVNSSLDKSILGM